MVNYSLNILLTIVIIVSKTIIYHLKSNKEGGSNTYLS